MSNRLGRLEMILYLGGVTGIGAASIAVFYVVFTTSLPRFAASFVGEPISTVRADPGSAFLILAGVSLVLLLIALVVVFGAKYGLEPEGNSAER